MALLSTTLKNRLNNENAVNRAVGLGTVVNSLKSNEQLKIEAITGTVNTNYAVIDDCEAANMDTADNDAIFKGTAVTTRYKKGSKSMKLESLSTATVGDHKVYNVINSANYSGGTHFGMWVYSDISLSSGEVKFYLKSTAAGDQTINLPAISPGVWTWIELSKGALTVNDIIRYGFKRNKAAIFTLWVDQITLIKSTELVTLGSTPIDGSVKIAMMTAGETNPHTWTMLTEDTDYVVGVDTKHVIFVTNQSTKAGLVFYAA